MHSHALLLSLFAVGVLATPVKRAVVTELDIVTKVVYVTATAGVAPKTEDAEPVVVVTKTLGHYNVNDFPPKHHGKHHTHPHHPTTTEVVQDPTSEPEPYTQPTPADPTKTKEPQPAPTNDYQTTVERHHNVHRANHSATDIHWDAGLAATAEKIGRTCYYAHNTEMDGGGYGQNIAAGVKADNISAIISDMFYNGEVAAFGDQYGLSDPTGFETWGHFSQVVWKGTKHVGCATVDCSAQGLGGVSSLVPPYFTVCNYANPGNYAGEYGNNVGEPLGRPTANWNY